MLTKLLLKLLKASFFFLLLCPPRPQDGFSALLRRHGGSRRNSLLRWCQSRTQGYKVRNENGTIFEIFLKFVTICKMKRNSGWSNNNTSISYIVSSSSVFSGRILRSQTSAAAGMTVWRSAPFITRICQLSSHTTTSTRQTRYNCCC